MMWWSGSWAWAWLIMMPMMVLMWALVAWAVMPWIRNQRDQGPSPAERLDERLAAGEISVEEHRALRTELEHRP